jgi:putative ABC transport system permease protein
MGTLWQDLRFGMRLLARTPGVTAVAVICLALGIGATTAIFSVVYSVLMRPLPYHEPERLVRIYTEFPTFPNGGLRKFWTSPPEFLEIRGESRAWESIEAWTTSGVNLAGTSEPVRATASFVSGGLLVSLGVQPAKGRLLTPADGEPDAPLTAVISHGLWQRAFGADPNVLSRELRLNGQRCSIVGVMRPGFHFPPGEVDPPEVWMPLQLNPANPGGRGSHFLYLLGRVKNGISFEQARSDMARMVTAFGARSAPNFHTLNHKLHPLVLYPLHEEVVGAVRPAMMALLAAVGFVLLIACVNVANILLARAEVRQREIAIRRAVGAGTGNLIRQLMAEGALLSIVGAAVGVLLAYAGLRIIVAAGQGSIPRYSEIALDGRTLLFTLGVSLLTGVFFGLAPLAQYLAHSLHDVLKSGGGRTTATVNAHRLRHAMVIGELALALVLLIGTGLMIRAFWKLQAVHVGLRPENVLTMRIALPQGAYPENVRVLQFWMALEERVRTLPGIASATMMTGMPPVRPLNANDAQIEGFVQKTGGPLQNVDYYQATGRSFFETLGVPLIEGRLFDDRDGAGGPPVIIANQTMARTFWPGQSAIGRRVKPNFQGDWRTVVGVVADIKNAGIDKPAGPELFVPAAQTTGQGLRNAFLVIRTASDPRRLIGAVRAEVAALDPSLPVANIRTMDEVIAAAQSRPRFLALLLTLFAVVALTLAAVGIYGVMSYMVAQRTPEIGVRMAMGASANHVLGMVVGRGMKTAAAGIVVGAIGAFALTRFIQGLLFGVEAVDPLTFAAMAGVLLATILIACYVPARRATRVDPLSALRYD